MICGYHCYKEIWTLVLDEVLQTQRKPRNVHDIYAVEVMRKGWPPSEEDIICVFSISKVWGVITCKINGNRHYSAGIEQGGLEIPCKLTFEGKIVTN